MLFTHPSGNNSVVICHIHLRHNYVNVILSNKIVQTDNIL